ncbi:MAG: glycosyltransferase, partial [Syntrophothermus sp.]
IVIDNASDDGSVEILREKYPSVKLIANRENIGFGAANNLGLKISRGEYILLINPDTIVQENTFSRLIEFFRKTPDAGLAGCKVLNSDGTLQLACRRSFPGPWTSFCKVTGLSTIFPKSRLFARYNLTYLDENKTYEVDAISGAFMLLKREVYEKVGGFDPQFFMYGEDLDLCYRIQKAGFKVYYFHDTQIIHYKGESTKRSNIDETKVFYDAMHLFVKKHFSSSFLVELILQFAIFLRTAVAFLNIYRLILLAVILDFAAFDLSLYLAAHFYKSVHWTGFPADTIKVVYTIPALIQIMIGFFIRSYKRDTFSVLRSFYAIFTGLIVLSSVTFFFKQYAYSRAVILITYLILLLAFPLWRMFVKLVFKLGRTENFHRFKTLIVGTDSDSIEIAKRVKSRSSAVHTIVGLIGLSRKSIGEKFDDLEVIGSLDNIRKIISDQRINEVIFSSNEISYNQMLAIVSKCQGENVDFKLAGSELGFLVGKSSITMLDDIPLLEVSFNITILVNRFFKKFMDILIAVPVLILIYPFAYLYRKISAKAPDFIKFVLGMPEVLSGHKSLVGPAVIPDNNALYLGKQGLTGLWYTELINADDKNDMNKLDIFYARNQNIWLDLEILGKTFSKMLNGAEF